MRHGTQYGYKIGCRCDECREAKSAADKASHLRHRENRLAANQARYDADPEKYRKRTRDRYATDPAYREAVKATARQWELDNPARKAERSRAWREANADALKEKRKANYWANRERAIRQAKEWADANPERRKEFQRAWKKRNPQQVLANVNIRRARKVAATIAPFTVEQLEQRLSMWSGCWICGAEATEIDHVKPLSKGGAHCLANLRPICPLCNQRKGTRWPFDVNDIAPSTGED
jgi:5-methylcytosine-specific restriction endonuclease McrA